LKKYYAFSNQQISQLQQKDLSMIEPQSIAERLMYCTVRISAQVGSGVSRGTGFFYNFPSKEVGQVVPVIITNKHVV
jgi:hypothetical protein